jgi:hypothetical protein
VPGATKPFIAVYVVWHPDFADGQAIADTLHDHFRQDIFLNVAGGTGVSVQFRFSPSALGVVPLRVEASEAETTAIVALIDRNLVSNRQWVEYLQDLARTARTHGLSFRIFPVTMEGDLTASLTGQLANVNCIRWDKLPGPYDSNIRSLRGALTYEFCRMLRHYLEHLKRPEQTPRSLERYLKAVRVFLSHSKHDMHGEKIAIAIRDHINRSVDLASFFDATNIPAGLNFDEVLEHYVRVSAVIAVQTDSYASREWCRREIIEAKRFSVPLIVINCVTDLEARGFPYLGNVPVVRMEPTTFERIPVIINRLLDEVFKDFLWRCRVQLAVAARAVFLPRPPELVSLLTEHLVLRLHRGKHTVVYPDPPLGLEEQSLLTSVAPRLRFLSYTEWIASV